MAITNAQQFKQLVNPPMEGKKRPGYRGEDAYGGGTTAGGKRSGGERGDGPASNDRGRDDRREQYSVASTLGTTQFGQQPIMGPEDKTGLETIRERNKALEKKLLGTTYEPFNTPFASVNFLANTLGRVGFEKTTQFFSDNRIGGKINPATGKPFGYGLEGYKDYMDQRRMGNVNAFGNPTISYDDQDDNDAYIFPRFRTMAQESSDMDQEPTIKIDDVDDTDGRFRRFRAEGGIMDSDVVGGEFDFESARQMYGLGKLVKKVTRTVKKIAKSPIGKAALIGGLGFYAGGGNLFGLQRAGMSGFSFGNLPGAALFAKSTPVKLAASVPDRLAFNAARTAAGSGASGGLLDLIGGKAGAAIIGSSLLAGLTTEQKQEVQDLVDNSGFSIEEARNSVLARARDDYKMDARARGFRAEGGPAEGKEPVAKKTMPLLDMGGQEMDLRDEGGFVPIGRMEKADDVPARLSKNEFVFTADAVRNAGDGNVDKGAEVMYNMMKNLEAGGDVSEESQGLEGARKMFQTSQRLEEVL